MASANHKPSPELLKAVRAGLILKDSSLSKWSQENGHKRQNVTKAVTSDWQGPKAGALVEALIDYVFGEAAQ